MDAQTAVVIEKLAGKLGTTSEYLWAVLIKQAAISATVDLVFHALTVAAMVTAWKCRASIVSVTQKAMNSHSDAVSFLTFMCALVFGIVAVVWLLACVFTVGNVVTALLNPEYWALEKVLSAVKGK